MSYLSDHEYPGCTITHVATGDGGVVDIDDVERVSCVGGWKLNKDGTRAYTTKDGVMRDRLRLSGYSVWRDII